MPDPCFAGLYVNTAYVSGTAHSMGLLLQGCSLKLLPQSNEASRESFSVHMQRVVALQDLYIAGGAEHHNDELICKGLQASFHTGVMLCRCTSHRPQCAPRLHVCITCIRSAYMPPFIGVSSLQVAINNVHCGSSLRVWCICTS